LPRSESSEQCRREGWDWNILLDCISDHPATFAGILYVAFQPFQPRIIFQGTGRQFQEPGADDAAMHPEVCDLCEVELVVAFRHQLEAFRISLHHAVFDSIMYHFHVMPGAHPADVSPALLGRQRGEDRRELFHRRLVTTDHQTVANGQAPNAAAGAGIDIVNLFLLEVPGPSNIVVESGIAAIDHRITRVEKCRDGLNGLLRRRAGWDHNPDRARGFELADKIGQ
jgi:hypothetical protein